jgi:hypothetical protein
MSHNQAMSTPGSAIRRREVAPLELFFHLVFVLAIGQLTYHLVGHLTWQGAAETLILLVAVCSVWVFTTFEVTLLDIERRRTHWLTVSTTGLALFMNAGIGHAFGASPWLFVLPMLVALVGPCLYAAGASPSAQLRGHFLRVLVWCAVSSPLWIGGAASSHETRLWLWAAAAAVDGIGAWTAHPVPGHETHTGSHPFDAKHMVERMRLFDHPARRDRAHLGARDLRAPRRRTDVGDGARMLRCPRLPLVGLLRSRRAGSRPAHRGRRPHPLGPRRAQLHLWRRGRPGDVRSRHRTGADPRARATCRHRGRARPPRAGRLPGRAGRLLPGGDRNGLDPAGPAATVLGIAGAPAYVAPAYAVVAAAVVILAATAAVIGRPAA